MSLVIDIFKQTNKFAAQSIVMPYFLYKFTLDSCNSTGQTIPLFSRHILCSIQCYLFIGQIPKVSRVCVGSFVTRFSALPRHRLSYRTKNGHDPPHFSCPLIEFFLRQNSSAARNLFPFKYLDIFNKLEMCFSAIVSLSWCILAKSRVCLQYFYYERYPREYKRHLSRYAGLEYKRGRKRHLYHICWLRCCMCNSFKHLLFICAH